MVNPCWGGDEDAIRAEVARQECSCEMVCACAGNCLDRDCVVLEVGCNGAEDEVPCQIGEGWGACYTQVFVGGFAKALLCLFASLIAVLLRRTILGVPL